MCASMHLYNDTHRNPGTGETLVSGRSPRSLARCYRFRLVAEEPVHSSPFGRSLPNCNQSSGSLSTYKFFKGSWKTLIASWPNDRLPGSNSTPNYRPVPSEILQTVIQGARFQIAPRPVTSPKGLHGWKHRFAVNRALSRGFAGPAGPKPLGFGSIGLHGVRIGSIGLQSRGLVVDCKQKKK